MAGLYRNDCQDIYCIEQAFCCKPKLGLGSCYDGDMWSSFDVCVILLPLPFFSGDRSLPYFVVFGVEAQTLLECFVGGIVSLPVKDSFVFLLSSISHLSRGWSRCKDGYVMTGMYRSACNELYCIEAFKCCELKK